jgi:hypothetical protein
MFELTTRQQHSIVNADARAIHAAFTDTLRCLKQDLEPRVREMYVSELGELQERARKLLDTQLVEPLVAPLLNHVLSRPVDAQVIVNRYNDDPKQLISSFIA